MLFMAALGAHPTTSFLTRGHTTLKCAEGIPYVSIGHREGHATLLLKNTTEITKKHYRNTKKHYNFSIIFSYLDCPIQLFFIYY